MPRPLANSFIHFIHQNCPETYADLAMKLDYSHILMYRKTVEDKKCAFFEGKSRKSGSHHRCVLSDKLMYCLNVLHC